MCDAYNLINLSRIADQSTALIIAIGEPTP
jgi:hypothetical protein